MHCELESDNAEEGSEEYFDESEHVDGLAEEERSTDGEDGFGEEVDETRERGRGREREGPKTHVGWPEEPQLRGVLMIQEELKRPSDCWYVPVCRVWGDSKEDA